MKRSSIALIALGSVLVIVVWFMFLINPKRSELSDIDDQIADTQVQAQGVRGEVAALKDIRDSELTYRRAIAEVESSIPATPDLAAFIEAIDLLSIETGVEVLSLTPSPPSPLVEGQLFQALSINIDAQGQFFEALGFLYGLQDLDRLVKINSVTMTTLTTGDGNREVSMTLRGSIFTLATDLPTPTVEPPPEPEEEPAPTTTTVPEESAAGVTDDAAATTTDGADA